MNEVMLGLGSNINREENIRSGVEILSTLLREMRMSPIYEARSVGFYGDSFFNLVVIGKTDMSLSSLAGLLRDIEFDHGREKNAEKYSSRTLDIDILTYGEIVGECEGIVLPRDEIVQQAYVLKPLVDLCGGALHPSLHASYRELWESFSGDRAGIWLSDFQLDNLEYAS